MAAAAPVSAAPLRVAVDGRPLDIPYLRAQGIGRYAHGLLAPLAEVAAERGGELVVLRAWRPEPSAYGGEPLAGAQVRRLWRPPVPGRFADWPEHALLPIDLRRARAGVAHALSIYRAALAPGVPTVMTMHDVVPLMWPDQYLRTGVMHRVLYRAARRARLLLAVSEAARRDVIAHLGVDPERIVHVPEAADERFTPTDPGSVLERLGLGDGRGGGDPYLLYVGGLGTHDPRKDLDGLIDGFATWHHDQGRAETLVLAGGEGEEAARLRERAHRSGAPIRFTGFVPDADLPALYSGANCLVTASRYEGFGLPALEAIACGTPVVAYDAGAIPEVAGPGGLYVPPGDATTLLRAAGDIADDAELRARLSAEGLRHAAGFSWRRTAELTWAAYERAARPT